MAGLSFQYFVFLLLFFDKYDSIRSLEELAFAALSSSAFEQMEGKPGMSALKKVKKVDLEDFPNYSVTIPLFVPATTHQDSLDGDSYEKISVTKSGKFIVNAPKGFGILAVVQNMNLPVLALTPEQETESDFEFLDPNKNKICTDYIQFSEGGKSGTKSEKICGKVTKDNYDFKPSDFIGQRSFRSPQGKIIVLFHFSATSDLFPNGKMPSSSAEEETDGNNNNNKSIHKLEIVFTAYKDCNLQLSSDAGNMYMPCGVSSSSGEQNDTCINVNLFCDNDINCGFTSSSFASDENNCPVSNITEFPVKSKKSIHSRFDAIREFFSKMWEEGGNRILSTAHREKPSLIENSSFGKLLYHAAPSSLDSERHSHSSHEGGDFEGIHFPTASGIILLIILAIVIVMSLSVVIRFCCFRCVGTTNPGNLLSTNNSDNITTNTSNAMYGAIPFPLGPGVLQPSSNNFLNVYRNAAYKKDPEKDKPPSYDELFPSSLLNKSDEDSSVIIGIGNSNEVANSNILSAASQDRH